jgi:hypothetical protein
MKKPVSPKRLAANRANAARSTGPRSAEGKARSAQNSRKHGFTASIFAVVRLEELDEVARLREDLIACYQPVNSQELFAIERIALAQQSLLRAARLENGMFTNCFDESFDSSGRPVRMIHQALVNDDYEITKAQNRNFILADGFHRLAKTANTWSLFLRYQAQAERLYRRAIEEFERLKALRHELPNEPILEAGAEADPLVPPQAGTGGGQAGTGGKEDQPTSCSPAPAKPTPCGNVPGQPPRYRPDGEILILPPSPPVPSAAETSPLTQANP